MSLQKTIEDQAATFAQAIVAALRGASIDELMTLGAGRAPSAAKHANAAKAVAAPRATRSKRGRLARRSADDIGAALGKIEAILRAHPEGMRAEQIRSELGFVAKEMPRPLKEGLSTGRLSKSGQKRATLYQLGSGGGAAKRAKRAKRTRAKR